MSQLLKYILTFTIILCSIVANSQQHEEGLFFSEEGETIKFYINAQGFLTVESKSDYNRIVHLPISQLPFGEKAIDLYPNGDTAFTCTIVAGDYHGKARYYYQSGVLKTDGYYEFGLRKGKWKFYYPNGNLYLVVEYTNSRISIIDFYTKTGKQKIVSGNGKYKGKAKPVMDSEHTYQISGRVVDSCLHGKWVIGDVTEEYNMNRLVKGYDLCFKHFTTILKSDELLDLGALGLANELTYGPKYDKGFKFYHFVEDLTRSVKHFVKSNEDIPDAYLFISFCIEENGTVENLTTTSNLPSLENISKHLIENTKWFPAQNISPPRRLEIRSPSNPSPRDIDAKDLYKSYNIRSYIFLPFAISNDNVVLLKYHRSPLTVSVGDLIRFF